MKTIVQEARQAIYMDYETVNNIYVVSRHMEGEYIKIRWQNSITIVFAKMEEANRLKHYTIKITL